MATLTLRRFKKYSSNLRERVRRRSRRGSRCCRHSLLGGTIGKIVIADAILDRLVHNAHRLTLKGDSMRKIAAKRSGLDASPAL